ncbi:MAG: EamA rane protein RarD [Devosia sp.]|uniref:DMT family transporter n=1 Tax=Devosia sp. TaxID=1871048 RepID=UPI00262B1D03|nr:DMT family transporter [Devosia sp.]MDB5588139.1 EamA rane protein RarD [Devosia sp.]
MSAPIRRADTASLKGMALGFLAYSLFAVHDAVVKGIIMELPVVQILFLRSLVIVVITLSIGRAGVLTGLRLSPNKHMMLYRAALTLAAWCMYYSTGRYLQLAEMTTLYYFAPVFTIVLAVIFLGERLTLARVGAAAIGFFGVIVACNPVGMSLGWPSLMVLAAAFCWSVAMILMRTISKSEGTLVQTLAINLCYVAVMGAASIFFWQPMDARSIAFVIVAGLIGGVAQYALVDAARLVPAGVLGTVEYSALIWAFVFGYLFWAEVPSTSVYLGAALITTAGLLVAWNERRRAPVLEMP